MQRRIDKSMRDPHQLAKLTADLSLAEDENASGKGGMVRAKKLNSRQKSRRARTLAQDRWNALHGKGGAGRRSRPRK